MYTKIQISDNRNFRDGRWVKENQFKLLDQNVGFFRILAGEQ